MKRFAFLLAFLSAASVSVTFAQQRVQMRNMYERLYLVVPIIGTGTPQDPRRPMYAPAPGDLGKPKGIVAFTFQESDDGTCALVHLVARDREAFKAIFEDNNPNVKIFEKGKHTRAEIETEFRKHKKNADLDSFVVNVP